MICIVLPAIVDNGLVNFMSFLKHVFSWMFKSHKDPYPVYVFHHIPKCGGTSLINLLPHWFNVISDYRDGWTMDYREALKLTTIPENTCICGHFELDGYHLYQRYPEILRLKQYQLFTFLRDPLDVKVSLYRFEMQNNVCAYKSFEECILSRCNYIADRFPATEQNYKDILDRYFFIGILERAQDSIQVLSKLLNKEELTLPCVNRTAKKQGSLISDLSPDVIRKFKNENKLDYAIYNYARQRFDFQWKKYNQVNK